MNNSQIKQIDNVSEDTKNLNAFHLELTIDGMPKIHQRHNFLLVMIQAAIFNFGWAMTGVVQIPFLNWLQLKESTIGLVGSFSFMSIIGLMFAPLISRKFKRKKFLAFFLAIPYLCSPLAIGVGILIAMHTNGNNWLAPMTIVCIIAWPFLSGWGTIPYQEYVGNCISKERIGKFVGVSQIVGPLLGLAGSALMTYMMVKFAAPFRYAIAFILAYLLAQSGSMFALFAHETPAPPPPKEPFWRSALDAFTTDRIFRKLLFVSFCGMAILWFTYTFVPVYAIREWGLPDWVAATYFTVLTGANMAGGFIATWVGQKIGYTKLMKMAFVVLLISFIPLVIPEMGEGKKDIFQAQWTVKETTHQQQIENVPNNAMSGDSYFKIIRFVEGEVNQLEVSFNRPVNDMTFNLYDIKIFNPAGKLVEISEVTKADDSKKNWKIIFKQPQSKQGVYNIAIYPYISDIDGNAMDQNGNGKTGKDQWRFFAQAVIYGIAYILINTCVISLMYILSPENKRAGYFSITNMLNQLTSGIFVFLSGLVFVPGNYRLVYILTVMTSIPITLICHKMLSAVVTIEKEKRCLS